MARWRTDDEGVRWLEGWADRDALRAWAAKWGHELDVWYALVAHGLYQREMGRCKYCDMAAGWGLIYQGKIEASVSDTSGAHRVRVKKLRSVAEIHGDEEEADRDEEECSRLVHPLSPFERTGRGLDRKGVACMWGPALTQPCRRLTDQTTQRRPT